MLNVSRRFWFLRRCCRCGAASARSARATASASSTSRARRSGRASRRSEARSSLTGATAASPSSMMTARARRTLRAAGSATRRVKNNMFRIRSTWPEGKNTPPSRNLHRPSAGHADPGPWQIVQYGPEHHYAVESLVPGTLVAAEPGVVVECAFMLQTTGTEYGWDRAANRVVKSDEGSLPSPVAVFATSNAAARCTSPLRNLHQPGVIDFRERFVSDAGGCADPAGLADARAPQAGPRRGFRHSPCWR